MNTTSISMAITTPRGAVGRMAFGARGQRAAVHDCDHGFCSICGAVWPCSRARRDAGVANTTFTQW